MAMKNKITGRGKYPMNRARSGSTAEERTEVGAVGAVISGARRARPQTTTAQTHLGYGGEGMVRMEDDDRKN